MRHEISNADDLIDSRGVIARIDELESERADSAIHTTCIHCGLDIEGCESDDEWMDRGGNVHCPGDEDDEIEHAPPADARGELDEDERQELEALRALAKEAEGYAPDWPYGETLIRETYFLEYAQELAEDIGAVNNNASWPNYCIDWERAARDLKMDYTEVDFDGVTYLIRS